MFEAVKRIQPFYAPICYYRYKRASTEKVIASVFREEKGFSLTDHFWIVSNITSPILCRSSWLVNEKKFSNRDNAEAFNHALAIGKSRIIWSSTVRCDFLWLSSIAKSEEVFGWKTYENKWRGDNNGTGIFCRSFNYTLQGYIPFLEKRGVKCIEIKWDYKKIYAFLNKKKQVSYYQAVNFTSYPNIE